MCRNIRFYVFSLSLGLTACFQKSGTKSHLNQIKIQTGEQAPALIIKSEGGLVKPDATGSVAWSKPSFDCNKLDAEGADLFLPEPFDPATYDKGPDADCVVFGWTEASSISTSYPAWKAGDKAIFLEGSRSSYPLGYRLEPADDIAMTVSACTLLPNASDQKDFKNCLAENKDYFAVETAGKPLDEKKREIGKAILEALQVLTYNDSGLQQCYERALLTTDDAEGAFAYPLQPSMSIFRALRQRSPTMSIDQDELDFLHEVIGSGELRKSMDGMDAYTLRALLALRMGYTYGSLDSSIREAFEPFGDLTSIFERQASDRLKALMNETDTGRLSSGADNLLLFADGGLQTLLNSPGHEFFVAATGNVDSLGQQVVKLPEGIQMTQGKARILSDIVYRAVLLAKATKLKPLEVLNQLKESNAFKESCRDYAEYRPGLPSGRDQLVRAVLLNDQLTSEPTVATGTFKGLLKDSEEQPYKAGIPPIALRRSPDCVTSDNPAGYCPIRMKVEGASDPRYKALKVRVRNLFSLTNKLWEKLDIAVTSAGGDLILISGKDSAELVEKGFFKSKTILPLLEIEGILKEKGTDLVFSSKLDRRAVACGDYRVGDEYLQGIENGSNRVRCSALGSLEMVKGPICDSGYSAIGNQCLKDCEGGHRAGETWPVTVGSHGHRQDTCENGFILIGAVTCDPGYILQNGLCEKKAQFWGLPHNLSDFTGIAAPPTTVFVGNEKIYMGTKAGLSVSANLGKTWTNKSVSNGIGSNRVGPIYADGATIIMATGGEGIGRNYTSLYISHDRGDTWTVKTEAGGYPIKGINHISGVGSTVFVSTGLGLFVSKDRGVTWSYPVSSISGVAMFGVYPQGQTLYATTTRGVYSSNDNAQTWQKLPESRESFYYDFGASESLLVYLVSGDVYRSRDKGQTWTSIASKMGSSAEAVFVEGNTIYAATHKGLAISRDGGDTWTTKAREAGIGMYIRSISAKKVLIGSAIHDVLCAATDEGLSISLDKGMTWTLIPGPTNVGYANIQNVTGIGSKLFASTIYRSNIVGSKDGGKTWTVLAQDIDADSLFYDGRVLLAATNSGLMMSWDDGLTWVRKTETEGLVSNYVSRAVFANENLYVLTASGVSISKDRGATWKAPPMGSWPDSLRNLQVVDGHLYGLTRKGLAVSRNGGDTWAQIEIRPPEFQPQAAAGSGDMPFGVLESFTVVGSTLYVGGQGSALFISKDGGVTWKLRFHKTAKSIGDIKGVGTNVYLATDNGVWISYDGGETWVNMTEADGLPGKYATSIHLQGDAVYAGTDKGLAVLNPPFPVR